MKYLTKNNVVIFTTSFLMACLFARGVMAFDHTHKDWDRLLKKYVVMMNNGKASRVKYSGFQKEQNALNEYLKELSAIQKNEFLSWPKNKQLAFLINAYNAFTIELILTKYPDIDSIWDTGNVITKPWRKKFFVLLGKKRHLDDIEHNIIRKKGVFNEFRIHFAVNCASIGCPALRNEAFVYDRLHKQLEDSMVRFLSDISRNRFDAKTQTLSVSKIFKWYKEDFIKTKPSLKAFFANYAHLFASNPEDLQTIREMNITINFLKYDWRLNDVKK